MIKIQYNKHFMVDKKLHEDKMKAAKVVNKMTKASIVLSSPEVFAKGRGSLDS